MGFVAMRKSHWGAFPHFLYVGVNPKRRSWRIVSFVPTAPRQRLIPPLVFHGQVRWGDNFQPPPRRSKPPAVQRVEPYFGAERLQQRALLS